MGSTGRRPREPPARHLRRAGPVGGARDREQAQPLCPAQDKQATRTKPGGRAVPAPPWPRWAGSKGGRPPAGGLPKKAAAAPANEGQPPAPQPPGRGRRREEKRAAPGRRRAPKDGAGTHEAARNEGERNDTHKRRRQRPEAAAAGAPRRRHPDARTTQPEQGQIKTPGRRIKHGQIIPTSGPMSFKPTDLDGGGPRDHWIINPP